MDNRGKSLSYKVYDKYEVQETDLSCTSQETDGRTEVTLITCTKNKKKRLVVKARAIENMSYVLFCNRDGNDSILEYLPSSVFADFKGNYNFAERFCYDCAGNKTQIINCECSKEKLVEFREKFPVWKDFDKFKIL